MSSVARTGPPVRTLAARLALLAGLVLLALLLALGGSPFRLGRSRNIATTGGQGYWLLSKDGGVFTYGDAPYLGNNLNSGSDIVGLAPTPSLKGYWTADDDGTVFHYGDAHDYGSRLSTVNDIRGFAARPQGDGYWLVTRDGVVTAKGSAVHYGDTPTLATGQKIVGMASTPSGNGYWLVGRDGGVFAFGDAGFSGSTGAITLNQPIVGIVGTPSGHGYWFVASDGGVFAFGDAAFSGSTGANPPASGIAGIARTASGHGYWLVAGNGKVFPFGDALGYGDPSNLTLAQPVVAIVATPVAHANQVPAAVADSASAVEDGTITVDVLANDTGLGDGPISVSITSGPAHGTASVGSDKRITYSPTANYNGPDSLTYKVTDNDGEFSSATLSLSVAAVNDAPVASGASATTAEDTPRAGSLHATDVDGDALVYSVVATPAKGSVVLNPATGAYTYTPNSDANGADSFTFRASDGTANSNTAAMSLTITPVNDSPVAGNLSVGTDEDTAKSGSVSATDVDGDALAYAKGSDPAHGAVVVNADGTFTYTPAANYDGTDSFTFKANDGTVDSAPATVTVTVAAVNDAPVLEDPADINLLEDATATVGLSLHATDADGDALIYSLQTPAAKGTAVVNSDGSYSYQPTADDNGDDSFVVAVTDGHGGSATATVEVNITPVNDVPVAHADAPTVTEDTPTDINVLANDSGLGDGGITVTLLSNPTRGTATVNADGTIHYAPNLDVNGLDSFSYRVVDADGDASAAGVSFSITPVNDPPTIPFAGFSPEVAEDHLGSGNLFAVDNDGPGPLTYAASSSNPALIDSGDFTFSPFIFGEAVSFQPEPNQFGEADITISVNDGSGTGTATASTTFHLTVDPINDAPAFGTVPGNQTIAEDGTAGPLAVSLSDVDNVPSDVNLTASSNDQTLLPDANLAVARGEDGNWTVEATPAADRVGTATITLRADDGTGTPTATATATYTVTVTPVNDVPVANADNPSTPEDTAITIPVLGNDVLGNDPALGDQPVSVQLFGAGPVSGTAAVNADNTITYTPAQDFVGTVCFGYKLSDSLGAEFSTAPLCVTVTPVNDPPAITGGVPADGTAINEDGSLPFTVTVADSDTPVEALTVTGSSSDQAVIPDSGIVITGSGANRNVTVTPAADANSADPITITLTTSDGQSENSSSQSSFTVVVTSANDLPAADNDTAVVNEDGHVTIPVLANDVLGNNPAVGDQPVVVTAGNGASGTTSVGADNQVTYTPNADFHGSDSFSYTVTDKDGDHSTATVGVTVNSVNDIPVAVDDTATVNEDGAINVPVMANDTGLGDGAPFTLTTGEFVLFDSPQNGTVSEPGDNTIRYVPNPNFNGTDTFQYFVVDNDHDRSNIATVTVTVNPVDDAVAANGDAASTAEDTPVTVNVLANDSYVDGLAPGGLVIESQTNGTAVVNGDDTVTFAPDANYDGVAGFTYHLVDNQGPLNLSLPASVAVTVNTVDDPVSADDSSATTAEDTPVTVDVHAAAAAPDGLAPLNPVVVDSASHGIAVSNLDDTITFTPDPDYNGSDASFSYTVTDSDGDSDQATVAVTVTPADDPALAVADAGLTTAEDTASVPFDVLANDSVVDGVASVTITGTSNGTAIVNDHNQVVFTPDADYNGPASFTYAVTDADGATTSSVTDAVVVTAIDDVPVGSGISETIDEDHALTIASPISHVTLGNDPAIGDQPAVISGTTNGAHGIVIVALDGSVVYTPAADWNGTDDFTYTVADGNGDHATVNVAVTVDPQADNPVAADFNVPGVIGSPVTFNLSDHISDPDGGNLTVALTSATAAGGTISCDASGACLYTPPSPTFSAIDSFTYQVTDPTNRTDSGTVTIDYRGII